MSTHESDGAPTRPAALRADEREAGVVAMLQDLAPHLAVEPDPEFRAATRQRLVAMAAVRSPSPARPSPVRRLLAARAPDAASPRWRTRVTAALAGAALTVTSLATLVALSTGARPGDVLYGLKRGTEQTQVALAGDARGQTLLDLARTRLDELRQIDGDAALARSTLATMDQQTTEGVSWLTARSVAAPDPAPLDVLAGWTAEQSARLDAVRGQVPAPATDDADASQLLLTEVTARVEGLRTALACPSGPATSGADRLGPVPAPCVVEPPAPETPAAPGGTPGSPAGTAPTPGAGPSVAVPSAPAPGVPAAPTTSPPAPGTVLPPAPGTSAPAPSSRPGGLLPSLPSLPSLLPPPPSTPAPTSPPLIGVPIPQVPLGVCLGGLLQLGRC